MARWRRWTRRIGIALAAVLLLLAGGYAALKYWIGPEWVRGQLVRGAQDTWRGDLVIDAVALDFAGRLELEGLRLADQQGRTWVQVGRVGLALNDLLSSSPVLTDVTVSDLRLTGYLDANGRLVLPLRPGENTDAADGNQGGTGRPLGRYVDLAVASIRPVAVELRDANDRRIIAARGMTLHFTGAGENPDPNQLYFGGQWELRDGTAVIGEHTLARAVNMTGRIDHGSEMTIVCEDLSAEPFEGRLHGQWELTPPNGQEPLRYRGELAADNVDVHAMLVAVAGWEQMKTGRMKAHFRFDAGGPDLKDLTGQGQAFITNADVHNLDVGAALFSLGGVDPSKVRGSQVDAEFTSRGLRGEFSKLQIGNALLPITARPGGWVDVGEDKLDLFFAALPAGGVLSEIPLVEILASATKNVIGVQVTGKLSDPTVTKRPVRDLARATSDFFKESLQAGGKLTETSAEGIGTIFKALTPGPK